MAHSNNIISSIKLPNNTVYQIHDAQAIHSAEELGLSSALVFKGTKATEAEIIGLTTAKVGDVWLCSANSIEYVCTTPISGTADASAWEKLGNIHDAASSTHTHTVTVMGTNASSAVTGTVSVPTVSRTQKYLSASAGAPSVTKQTGSVLGKDTKFTVSGGAATVSKTSISATASGAAVGANGTAKPITALGTPTTASAITSLNTATVNNPTVTAVSIPNVTGNTSVTASRVSNAGSKTAGTSASWGASVSADGVLSFSWTTNTPTDVTLPTFTSVTATNTTMGTALSASSVTTSEVTVATGSKTTAAAITGFPTPTTATCLTGVKVTAQPTVTLTTADTGDVEVATGVSTSAISVTPTADSVVTALTGVTLGSPSITLTEADATSTGAVPVISGVTVGSTSANIANGVAAAQTWTQSSGNTSAPKD